jgi:hypothetical protein
MPYAQQVMVLGLGIHVGSQMSAVAFTPQVLLLDKQKLNPLNLIEY